MNHQQNHQQQQQQQQRLQNHQREQQQQQQRKPLATSLRWLQACLLLLFGHDVLCFSLGYPFLPSVFGGPATGLAFSCYGLASIAVLLLLLFCGSSSSSTIACDQATRKPGYHSIKQQQQQLQSPPLDKFWRIVSAACLAAAAGAANTVLPDSYSMLLLTKATQGAASALYFCDSLSLVAAVFPHAHRTQAMAFISAGLTVGDALGPVLGGLVYQAAGLRAALALQPVASVVAVAAWGLLLLWGPEQRPWGSKTAAGAVLQLQQQQQDSRQGECRGQQGSGVLEPLLLDADDTPCLGSDCRTAQQLPTTLPATPAAAAAAAAAEGGGTRRVQLLQQLLRRPAILSLCLLALVAQAARTAVDLLLPIMLQGSVEPGIIGVLFAGEAVGSVVAPFVVDWMLSRHDNSSSSIGGRINSSSSKGGSGKAGAAAACDRRAACGEPCSSSNSSSSRRYASWLLLLSAAGMAICCACVLALWQLPAALNQATVSQPPTNTPGQLTAAQTGTGVVGQQMLSGFAAVGRAEWALQPSSNLLGSVFNCTGVDSDPVVSCMAGGIVSLKILQHPPWGASFAIHAPAALMSGTGNNTSTGCGGGLSHSLDPPGGVTASLTRTGAAADGSPSFGVVELCIIAVVLLLLGSCHSSCETLIYTVLTDAVAVNSESGSGNESGCERGIERVTAAAAAAAAATAAARSCPDDIDVLVDVDVDVDVDVHSVPVSGHAPSGCVSSSSSTLGSPEVVDDTAAAAAAAAADPFECISSTSSSCIPESFHCDVEVQVADDVTNSTSSSSAGQGLESDCTEVVMVLYVLFWVVGFSVGAGVVGLLPGSELAQLQAVASVLGLMLGAAGRWAWLAVS